MSIYNANACYTNVQDIQKKLEKVKYHINKNFEQMDFKNADAREDMREIIDEMLRIVDREIERVGSYDFKEFT